MRDQQRKGQLGDYGPFVDQADWDLATWLMDSGASQTEIDKFLKLDVTRMRTRPSYAGKQELLRKIDALPSGPEWTCHMFVVHSDQLDYNGEKCTEELDIWCRDPVACVNELLANPLFREHLKFAPEKLFTDDSKEDQIIHEMWTAQWWWDLQARSIHCDDKTLPLGATIAPVILASDKTQLSRFSGDKEAWPVYISVGNIAKSVRRQTSKRAMILLGYIPVTKLECLSEATCKDRLPLQFHYCMSYILKPLIEAGKEGVLMACADNLVQRVFPILAAYLADYPEQCLVACHQENSCPICEIAPSDRGEPVLSPSRNPTCTLKALKTCRSSVPSPDIRRLCLRAVDKPFWEDLPHTNIFQCFTPDLLHQLHKGVFKDHLVKWCIQLAGAEEVDRRFQALPDHPCLRYFKKGISTISQWTGCEHKEMERVFASLIYGAVPPHVTAVARAVIDFIYYASFASHSTETLRRLQDALDTFHQNKQVFIDHHIRTHFRIPKIHMMEHYVALIRSKGSADGFNTELSERLHIDCAKEGYRASNKKNYTQQMIKYLTRHEAIDAFKSFLAWTTDHRTDTSTYSDSDSQMSDDISDNESDRPADIAIPLLSSHSTKWKLAKEPPYPHVSLQFLKDKHGAVDIVPALTTYLATKVPGSRVTRSNYDLVDVYAKISRFLLSPQQLTDETQKDSVRATPFQHERKQVIPQHFDTALVHDDLEAEDIGLKVCYKTHTHSSYRVARVRVIFRLPGWFHCDHTLAYIEWFRQIGEPNEPLHMSPVSYATREGRHHAAIVPIHSILRSCHLTPKFSRQRNATWTA
ncbi:hypothetical protein JB92DRAFT_2813160 [Gautieria morchelliformis]|nr:hypothetical protein JB92DRAFT_2813160 [Gautieria morchelliformis]